MEALKRPRNPMRALPNGFHAGSNSPLEPSRSRSSPPSGVVPGAPSHHTDRAHPAADSLMTRASPSNTYYAAIRFAWSPSWRTPVAGCVLDLGNDIARSCPVFRNGLPQSAAPGRPSCFRIARCRRRVPRVSRGIDLRRDLDDLFRARSLHAHHSFSHAGVLRLNAALSGASYGSSARTWLAGRVQCGDAAGQADAGQTRDVTARPVRESAHCAAPRTSHARRGRAGVNRVHRSPQNCEPQHHSRLCRRPAEVPRDGAAHPKPAQRWQSSRLSPSHLGSSVFDALPAHAWVPNSPRPAMLGFGHARCLSRARRLSCLVGCRAYRSRMRSAGRSYRQTGPC